MENIFLVSGGGTGGHFFPAVSFINTLNKQGINSVYVGSSFGIENSLKDKIPTKVIFLNTRGFVGKNLYEKAKSIYSMFRSVILLNNRTKEDFLGMTFGGYASLPVGILSFLKFKKLFIHEQNTIPSLTNRVLSKKAKICFSTFYHTSKYFKNAIRVGIPIREEFLMSFGKEALQKELGISSPCILVLGGSQGAKVLNEITIDFFEKTNYHAIIITGDKHYQEISQQTKHLKHLKVMPFSHEIHKLMRACDVAISRAGASTIYELAVCGLPAVFIPYPYAAYNHQYINAKEIESLNGSVLIEQKDLNINTLSKAIEKILQDKDFFSKNINNFCIKNKNNDIILPQELILSFIKGVI